MDCKTVEKQWRPILETACKKAFAETHIPSHDFSHHRRVWRYSRELLNSIDSEEETQQCRNLGNLLAAAYFHDTGLTIEPGEEHGAASLQLFNSWTSNHPDIADITDERAAEAILRHDDKTYKLSHSASRQLSSNETLTLLSIADDLDAFGFLGIARYTEIYLLRGVSPCHLPGKVVKNLESRWQFIEPFLVQLPTLYTLHRERYQIAHQFFKRWADCCTVASEYAVFANVVQRVIVDEQGNWHMLAAALNEKSWSHISIAINGIIAEISQ